MSVIQPSPAAASTFTVEETSQVMSQTVATILNALVATGKDHCTVCYELFSVMNEVANND
jgi:hypothetical protein